MLSRTSTVSSFLKANYSTCSTGSNHKPNYVRVNPVHKLLHKQQKQQVKILNNRIPKHVVKSYLKEIHQAKQQKHSEHLKQTVETTVESKSQNQEKTHVLKDREVEMFYMFYFVLGIVVTCIVSRELEEMTHINSMVALIKSL